MPQPYYMLLTAVGAAKKANKEALGQSLQLTELAVGDGSGAYVAPDQNWLALDNEVDRVAINQIYQDPDNLTYLVVEAVIPQDIPVGYYVREVGIFDVDGDMIMVGAYPQTYKPTLAEGAARDLYIRAISEIGNTASVELKIDPSIVLATRIYVDTEIKANLPAGTLMSWPTETPPDGWLECDGAAILRASYADLFLSLGTKYGIGDGATTFNIPDYRGEFLRGLDNGAGNDPDAATRTDRGDGTTGDNVGTKQGEQLGAHSHPNRVDRGSPTGSGFPNFIVGDLISNSSPGNQDTGLTGGNETRPRNTNVMYLIKY